MHNGTAPVRRSEMCSKWLRLMSDSAKTYLTYGGIPSRRLRGLS